MATTTFVLTFTGGATEETVTALTMDGTDLASLTTTQLRKAQRLLARTRKRLTTTMGARLHYGDQITAATSPATVVVTHGGAAPAEEVTSFTFGGTEHLAIGGPAKAIHHILRSAFQLVGTRANSLYDGSG
jgi:hypothetical protein